jgi:hypothetical protein
LVLFFTVSRVLLFETTVPRRLRCLSSGIFSIVTFFVMIIDGVVLINYASRHPKAVCCYSFHAISLVLFLSVPASHCGKFILFSYCRHDLLCLLSFQHVHSTHVQQWVAKREEYMEDFGTHYLHLWVERSSTTPEADASSLQTQPYPLFAFFTAIILAYAPPISSPSLSICPSFSPSPIPSFSVVFSRYCPLSLLAADHKVLNNIPTGWHNIDWETEGPSVCTRINSFLKRSLP